MPGSAGRWEGQDSLVCVPTSLFAVLSWARGVCVVVLALTGDGCEMRDGLVRCPVQRRAVTRNGLDVHACCLAALASVLAACCVLASWA